MSILSTRRLFSFLFVCLLSFVSQTSQSHFPWLATDEAGHALLFFSESPAERDYHLPESVTKAVVTAVASNADSQVVELTTPEIEGFAGRRSTAPITAGSSLQTAFQYGIYHGTLLQYYAKTLPPIGEKAVEIAEKDRHALDAIVVPTKAGMQLVVTWKGKPLKGASVTIVDAEGETAEEKTDEDGKASFSTGAEGLTGFIIGHVVKDAKGEWEGKPYSSESHYCTLTTEYRMNSEQKKQTKAVKASVQSTEKIGVQKSPRYAPLPEAVASFGAAVCDGWLYVYSGHTGKAHDHSRDNLSESFLRLSLGSKGEWETLPMQTTLQGLPLVTYGGMLYRVGGLNATNAAGEDAVMHSVDEFARFDPATREWTTLPSLPERRSSHDAVVLNGKLYVVGGWTLSGDSSGEWLEKAWEYDLTGNDDEWKALPSLPFQRRALAVAHWDGKLVALGGMDEDHSISQSVDCFDPASGKWSKLADFRGEGMSGFGISAWNVAEQLYASGSEGIVYRLDNSGKTWTKIAELNRPRFFHRLLARNASELLIIGGAPLDAEGHLTDIESVGL